MGYRVEVFFATLLRLGSVVQRRVLIANQMVSLGLNMTHVVLFVGLFMGMIVALQTGIELARIGQQDQIGVIVAISMAREMGPFITAIILAATSGSSIAAELGTMSVSDELAALQVMSIDRFKLLVLPRVVALAIMCPLLTILCDAIGILGGGVVASGQLNVGWLLYSETALDALRPVSGWFSLPYDVYVGLLKSFVFGIIIAVISCSEGMQAKGGALGVGHATRAAVRDSIIFVIITNYMISQLLYTF
ncbi:MAG: phospholipid/cholesterol/gamma-HCH transport system permease protein [Planctomycetota bacterium]|jgi:phospholipid/cholesterol/gamma-HCH transport system permease protein